MVYCARPLEWLPSILPKICIGGPICIDPNLSGILTSEISDLQASLVPKYFIDPARLPAESDLDAEFHGHSNKWQIFIDPVWVHVDPIDVPATVGNLIEQLVKDAINNMLWFLPDWAKDLIWWAIGPVIDLIKSILGIVGDVVEWISDLLGHLFDLLGLIETAVADYFANKYPLYEFEDPYPILDGSAGLIPVKIPIRDLTASVTSKEMLVQGNVGA